VLVAREISYEVGRINELAGLLRGRQDALTLVGQPVQDALVAELDRIIWRLEAWVRRLELSDTPTELRDGIQSDIAPYSTVAMYRFGDAIVAHAGAPGDYPTSYAGEPELPEATDSFVYLETDDSRDIDYVLSHVDDFLYLLGYGAPVDEEVRRGSFWRRARAVLRQGLSSNEIRNQASKLERAVELIGLDDRQSQVDERTWLAVAGLVESLENVSCACIKASSLLLVKYSGQSGPVLVVRQLTQQELAAWARFPEIQDGRPEKVLSSLAHAVEALKGIGQTSDSPRLDTSWPPK
jgi:hypothetical protein